MNKKTIGIIIGAGILAIILIVIAVVIYLNSSFNTRQERILRQEAEKLGSLDITKDEVDMTIKTRGDYAVIDCGTKRPGYLSFRGTEEEYEAFCSKFN